MEGALAPALCLSILLGAQRPCVTASRRCAHVGSAMSKKQEEGEPPVDRRIKVLSMGAAGAGKSCLIKRYCEGKVRRAGFAPCEDPATLACPLAWACCGD